MGQESFRTASDTGGFSGIARVCLSGLACLCAVLSASNTTSASIQKLDVVYFERPSFNYGGVGGGGVFEIFRASDDTSLGYTVCLEVGEYLELGKDNLFKVGAVSDRAVLGGKGPSAGGDPVDPESGFLWEMYNEEDFAGFNAHSGETFDKHSDDWNDAIQQAVWHFEEEGKWKKRWKLSDEAKALVDYAESKDLTDLSSNIFAINLFDVSVSDQLLEAFDPEDKSTWNAVSAYHAQDQLWHHGDGGSSFGNGEVPEPTTVLMWSALGLAGVGFHRFRKARKTA